MNWPSMSDYQEAIQNPANCFGDAQLKLGRPALNALGLPQPVTGGFCSVYQVTHAKSRWAVRCFLHNIEDLRDRYAQISRYINKHRVKQMVGFEYVAEGIRVRNHWHPVLKMEWVDGDTLDRWVENHLDDPSALRKLAERWVDLMQGLEVANIGHCDLQHGNVLVDRGDNLRLIDYDGMYVPPLRGRGSHEKGHPAYQHPQREGKDFEESVDRFSALVIHTSLLALAESRELWKRFYMEDNLLFSRADFQSPDSSEVFAALDKLGGPIAEHARLLREACTRRLQDTPALAEVLGGKVSAARPSGSMLKVVFGGLGKLVGGGRTHESTGSNGAAGTAVNVPAPAPIAASKVGSQPAWMPGAAVGSHAAPALAPPAKSRGRGASAAAALALPAPQLTPDPVLTPAPALNLVPKKKKKRVTSSAASATGGWSLQWIRPGELHESHVWQLPVYGEREVPRKVLGIALGTRRERFVESYNERLKSHALRMRGHSSAVTSLAFTPDGQLLASASRDGTLRVWDVAGGREAYARLETRSRVLTMALVPGQQCIAAVLADKQLVLWEFGRERRVTHLKAPFNSTLRALAVSNDGRWIAAGGNRRQIYLWNAKGGAAAGEIKHTTGRIHTLAFTPDASGIACSTHKSRVELFDRASGTPRWSIRTGLGRMVSLAIPPRLKSVLGGAAEGTIACWDLENGTETRRDRPLQDRLASLAVAQEGSQVLSGFVTGKAFLTKLGVHHELALFEGHPGPVTASALATTNKSAATGCTDGTIRVWQME